LFVLALVGLLALPTAASPRVLSLLVLWAGGAAVTILGFREWAQVVPGFALLAALGLDRLWGAAAREGLGLGSRWAGRLALLAFLGSLFVLSMGRQTSVSLRAWYERGPNGNLAPAESIGRYVRGEVPAGSVFIWGQAGEVFPLSGRDAASRFLNSEALGHLSPHYQEHRAILMAELERNQPVLLVVAPNGDEPPIRIEQFPALRDLLSTCYQRVDRFAHLPAWKLYERLDKGGAPCAPR
jgi:hypothetical protein